MSTATPTQLHYTDSDDANTLLATDPLALLIGFALDQQVPVQTAFLGPLKIKQRLGTLEVARLDPAQVEAAFREKPAVHRFPGSMAARVQELAALVEQEYGGDASRLWREATDSADLRKRIEALPGFGKMKVIAFGSVLAKRFGVQAAEGLVPSHPTLGDVDSREALENYQAAKRAHKAKMRGESH
ncbi:MAG TPA: HhH-GPD-type base excision DNA repair protein [Gaiellaceae bacterium]|nr:HhH-GPD-type base excision DNA repair protein [Gaiellaceae bacterium]